MYTPSDDALREPPDAQPGEGEPRFPVRVLRDADLPAVIAIDAGATGSERSAYYREKYEACVFEPGINTSLVAEADGVPVGFLFGRLFFGEFGVPATRAVLDTIGVRPAFARRGVATALLAQYRKNLQALRVEAVNTLVAWDRLDLLGFFRHLGFRPSREMDLVWDTTRYPFRGRRGQVAVHGASAEDVAAVTAIDRETLHGSRSRYFAAKQSAAWERPERTRFLVARREGEVAGFLIASLFEGEFGIPTRRGVIDSFAVRERDRHQGVGSALMEHLMEWLRQREVTQMETLCHWNEWALLQFFEYAGFRPSARLNLEWRIG